MTEALEYDVVPALNALRSNTADALGIDDVPIMRDVIHEIETLRRVVAQVLCRPLVDDEHMGRTLASVHSFDHLMADVVRRCGR